KCGGVSASISRKPTPPAKPRITYPFNRPVPRRIDELVWTGKITKTVRDVLHVMLNLPSTRLDSCWTARRVIAKRLNCSTKTVQTAWDVLEGPEVAALGRVEFGRDKAAPDDPKNRTGRRFYFLDYATPRGLRFGADRRRWQERKRTPRGPRRSGRPGRPRKCAGE